MGNRFIGLKYKKNLYYSNNYKKLPPPAPASGGHRGHNHLSYFIQYNKQQ
jgi:hypothetical protein